jgi:hypothetical protein
MTLQSIRAAFVYLVKSGIRKIHNNAFVTMLCFGNFLRFADSLETPIGKNEKGKVQILGTTLERPN